MTFQTVLIANRGEIALRTIEACRELDLRTIAVYSEADAAMPYLELADASVCVGPAEPAKSYRNIASIISAAELTGAQAIHPGYGFLAEDPHFVEICEEHGIIFVGPSVRTMQLVGDKQAAREALSEAGVPVLPGGLAPEDGDALLELAETIGYPLLLKPVYGGGGRGMRLVSSPEALHSMAAGSRAEAKAASGDARLYLERAVSEPRHVEVQILADGEGRIVHLGERDCSIQRRHQKMVEESPAPRLDDELRHRLRNAAIVAAKATGYRNAGTVEFLVDGDRNFYFVEMNARIQVEHSVSEAVTGTNLIVEQLKIAGEEPLQAGREEMALHGHAIECRITAEDPARGFAPSCGTVRIQELPGGNNVRVDTALFDGMHMSPHYDSLLAKIVTWGRVREEARVRMLTALERFRVSGVATTAAFLREVISHPAFRRGEQTTGFVGRLLEDSAADRRPSSEVDS